MIDNIAELSECHETIYFFVYKTVNGDLSYSQPFFEKSRASSFAKYYSDRKPYLLTYTLDGFEKITF